MSLTSYFVSYPKACARMRLAMRMLNAHGIAFWSIRKLPYGYHMHSPFFIAWGHPKQGKPLALVVRRKDESNADMCARFMEKADKVIRRLAEEKGWREIERAIAELDWEPEPAAASPAPAITDPWNPCTR